MISKFVIMNHKAAVLNHGYRALYFCGRGLLSARP
jgi:hypothetical protein